MRRLHSRCWGVVVIAIGLAGRPAIAQRVLVQADGTVNLGYTQTTRSPIQSDPMGDAADALPESVGSVFTEVRPGIVVQSGSPRLSWLAGYMFSGAFSPGGEDTIAYSNQANAGLVGQISKFSSVAINASIAQGGTSFLLSQRPAEMNTPEIRAPGDPKRVTATLAETYSREIGERSTLQQGFTASFSAPQSELDKRNTSLTDSVAIDHMYGRDNVGAEIRGNISRLRPLREDLAPYTTLTGALLARWNHDFSASWNGTASAGVEQVYTGTGSRPLALLPTATAALRYSLRNVDAAVQLSHGSATNIQVGTVSLTDQITARGVITLDPIRLRLLTFSVGALHNEPIGEVAAVVAAGTGNALQADAAFSTALTRNVSMTARYSLAYQFGQSDGLAATLTHVLFVGVTASYSNSEDVRQRLPRRGVRVDGADGEGFPVIPDSPP